MAGQGKAASDDWLAWETRGPDRHHRRADLGYNRVELNRGLSPFAAAAVLIVGAADCTLLLGGVWLSRIGLVTFGVIVLYRLFRNVRGRNESAAAIEGARQPAGLRGRAEAHIWPT